MPDPSHPGAPPRRGFLKQAAALAGQRVPPVLPVPPPSMPPRSLQPPQPLHPLRLSPRPANA